MSDTEKLAALLREYGALVMQGREHDADKQAAWLIARGVTVAASPAGGGPTPSAAAIRAASASVGGLSSDALIERLGRAMYAMDFGASGARATGEPHTATVTAGPLNRICPRCAVRFYNDVGHVCVEAGQ